MGTNLKIPATAGKHFDPLITYVSGGLIILFVLVATLFPKPFESWTSAAFAWTTQSWGWLYLLVVFGLTASCLLFMIGPWGGLKLGPKDSKPDYPNFTWFALLFSSAIAAGIAFWGPVEPLTHYNTVPPFFKVAAQTPDAAVAAMTQSFFHWGLSAWAIYVSLTIPLAHAAYTKNIPLRFSSAFYYLLGDRVFGPIGKVIDIFAVIATMGGLATTTGLTALQVVAGLKSQYGIDLGPHAGYIVIAVFTAIFTFAVYTGLEKGVKIMGDINIYLFGAFWAFIFIFGPKLFFLELGIEAGGQYLFNFIPLSLFTQAGVSEKWTAGWTIFYWAWWMSWAPFVSIFIARISRGRSIRSLVIACMFFPSIANFLWYTVVGGAGIYFKLGDFSGDKLPLAIFAMIQNYPLPGLVAVVVMFLVAMLFLTSANSAAISLAMFVSGREKPHKYLSTFWALSLGAVAAVLAGTGNLQAIQTASIVGAFPLMFLLIGANWGAFKGLTKALKDE